MTRHLGLIRLAPDVYLRLERVTDPTGDSIRIAKWGKDAGGTWAYLWTPTHLTLSWDLAAGLVDLLPFLVKQPEFFPPDLTAHDLARLLYSAAEAALSTLPPERGVAL